MYEPLPQAHRTLLLELARDTLEATFAGRPLPLPDPLGDALTQRRAAFVTLTIKGALRGCIGHVEAVEPLWRSVRDNTLAAAFRDPRFPPLEEGELEQVVIEISVLTPMQRVTSPDEVVVGTHGLLIERGQRRGLLLPQVASERGWDRFAFLDQTCRKAGLDPGCWRSDETRIFVFCADHFREPG
jgi:AmmeMemoRadiSam system protein A